MKNVGNTLVTRSNKFFEKEERCFFCEVNEKTNGEYKVIEFTGDSRSNYIIEHSCGRRFKETRTRFRLKGFDCICGRKNYKKHYTLESFSEKLSLLYNDQFKILSEKYIPEKIGKMKFLCKKCGIEFEKESSKILEGRSCPNCWSTVFSKTTADYKKEVERLFGDSIEILSEYTGYENEIEIEHKECGTCFKRTARDLLRSGYDTNGKLCGCPTCREISRGEEIIRGLLKDNNIIFKEQQKLPGCKFKGDLIFDFLVFNPDNSLKCIIEFDGPQHEEKNIGKSSFITKENWETIHGRDEAKNEYCKKFMYRLIRIPYSKLNKLEKVLKDENII